MLSITFIFLAIIQAVFLVIAVRQWQRQRTWYILIAIINLIALTWDNLAVGIGRFIGESDLLKVINAPRFIMHALFPPWLIVFAFGVARRVGLGWAQSKTAHAIFCLLSLALTLLGSWTDIVKLTLSPKIESDTLRYVNTAVHGPPIPVIVVIIVFIVIGILVWRKTKSLWMLLGSLIEFGLAQFGVRNVVIGNVGEIFFSAGIVGSEQAAQQAGKLSAGEKITQTAGEAAA